MSRRLLIALAAAAALPACQRDTVETSAPAPAPPRATTVPASDHAFEAAITEADFAELVETLASDEFEGRGPGSPGEERTVEYLRAQMQRIGLQPGNGDSYFQQVPMTETRIEGVPAISVGSGAQRRSLAYGTDAVVGSRAGRPEVKVEDSELVFVGYGVDAPEREWNDYAGVDVRGKTVVILVNDPGFHAGDKTLFDGEKMTYYGRWTYKFEEAARKGAAAALIIHDTEGASYGWDVVKNSWSGPQYDLTVKDDPEPRLPAQGWITGEAARQLFADAGLDLDAQYRAAGRRGFKAVPLKSTLSLALRNSVTEKSSRNVVGVLPGTGRADEAVVYLAHWDHLGKQEGEGDTIYNGAIDNATGVAGILEVAEAFAAQQPPPQRSVVFLAVTLEESGLLGSKYYVAHPSFPLDKIAGVINLDAMSAAGRSRNMTVTGLGSSELEDILAPIAAGQDRTLAGEANTAAGYYFRSDHFNFAKAGVPALYVDSGDDLVEGGTAAGKRAAEDYASRYHTPRDEFDPQTWKLDGIVEDLEAVYAVGSELAGGDRWPNWYEGNPFKAARDAMMGEPANAQ